MTRLETLAKRYGLSIYDDSFYDRCGKKVKCYRIYTADGCPWENGLTLKGVESECKQWGKAFLEIKEAVEKRKAGTR